MSLSNQSYLKVHFTDGIGFLLPVSSNGSEHHSRMGRTYTAKNI